MKSFRRPQSASVKTLYRPGYIPFSHKTKEVVKGMARPTSGRAALRVVKPPQKPNTGNDIEESKNDRVEIPPPPPVEEKLPSSLFQDAEPSAVVIPCKQEPTSSQQRPFSAASSTTHRCIPYEPPAEAAPLLSAEAALAMGPRELLRRRLQLKRMGPWAQHVETDTALFREQLRQEQDKKVDEMQALWRQQQEADQRKKMQKCQEDAARHKAETEELNKVNNYLQFITTERSKQRRMHRQGQQALRDEQQQILWEKEQQRKLALVTEKQALDLAVEMDMKLIKGQQEAKRGNKVSMRYREEVLHQEAMRQKEERKKEEAEEEAVHLEHYTQFVEKQEQKRKEMYELIHQRVASNAASASNKLNPVEVSFVAKQKAQETKIAKEAAKMENEFLITREKELQRLTQQRVQYRATLDRQIQQNKTERRSRREDELSLENAIIHKDRAEAQRYWQWTKASRDFKRDALKSDLNVQLHYRAGQHLREELMQN